MTNNNNQGDSQPQTPNFCDQCGHSLKPLDTFHTSRPCDECGKEIFFVESGEGGKGIKLKAGDKFHIPKGGITISLDPASGGKLYRRGLAFLNQQKLFAGGPKNLQDSLNVADYWEQKFDPFLKESPLLKHLNLESEEDGKKGVEILSNRKDTREWWALTTVTSAKLAMDAIDENDALKAAKAMYFATNAHAMTVMKEQTFEDTLWRGYLANQVVYESAAAAAHTPAESEAIKKLEPLFNKLEESVLHTWVTDGLPIGPRIGVREIPENTLLALAKWHLSLFSRKREEDRHSNAEKRANWGLLFRGIGVGLTIATVVAGALKYFGIL